MSCVLKAIADSPRRTILRSLRSGELPAQSLGELTHVSESSLTRHLRVLRRAGLLRELREGGEPRYLLERERLHALATRLRSVVAEG